MRFTHKQKILSIIKTELNKNKNKNNLILRKTYDIISKPMINIKSFRNYKRFKINRYKNIYCNRGIYDEYFDKNTIWINEKFDFTKEILISSIIHETNHYLNNTLPYSGFAEFIAQLSEHFYQQNKTILTRNYKNKIISSCSEESNMFKRDLKLPFNYGECIMY